MTDQRAHQLTDLPVANSAALSDILYIVTNPTNNANASFSISVAALANSMITKNTPTNSTITVSQGTIYYDNNYLYIASSPNTLKRVAIQSF